MARVWMVCQPCLSSFEYHILVPAIQWSTILLVRRLGREAWSQSRGRGLLFGLAMPVVLFLHSLFREFFFPHIIYSAH